MKKPNSLLKIVAIVVLLGVVVGMAQVIEAKARPDTGREGVHVQGSHDGH